MALDIDNLNDFGFSTLNYEEFEARIPENDTDTEETNNIINDTLEKIHLQLQNNSLAVNEHKNALNGVYQKKMEEVEKLIIPLLQNLIKTSSNDYIYWPNRKELLENQIEKIRGVTQDSDIFSEL